MTNTILSDAEARVAPAVVKAKAQREAIIEEMRAEIGQQHYDEAKRQLPLLELLLAKEVRPYLNRVAKISQGASMPLPASIAVYLRELEAACATAPDWVRVGIAEWNGLQAPFAKGSQEIDLNRRSEEIGSIRIKLRNWSGRESRMRDLMDAISNFISESGWPSAQPVGAAPIVRVPEPSNEIVVVTI